MAEAIELSQIRTHPSIPSIPSYDDIPATPQESTAEPVAHVLPPVDGGHRAWLFLASATFIELLVWGIPFSVGILHVYWTSTLFPGQGASTVTLAATLQTGLLYMFGGIFGPIFAAFPRWQVGLQVAGIVAGSPWHLVITMGCLYPISGACYFPCATLLFEWFHAKRGLATGIMYAGTGMGGAIFPFVIQGLMDGVGYKAAMVSLGVGYAILGSIALIPIRRRIPLGRHDYGASEGRRARRIDVRSLMSLPLAVGITTILVMSLGNFIPSLWIPSYAEDLKLSHPDGTALIAILNASSVPGNAFLGYLSDRFPLRAVMIFSCAGTSLACAFLWGFGTNSGMLVAFSVVFGLLGPSFCALWSKMIGVISKDDPIAPGLIFSIFIFTRGVGNLTSGPISQAFLKLDVLKGAAGAYGRNNYGVLLIYTATTIMGGGATGMWFKA
ncbi:hypothetical protein IAT38_004202 [Cryptococcus sp. DSM 104549]